jgi:hypothetical protein
MNLTDRLLEVKPCNPADYIAFVVDGLRVGLILPAFAKHLEAYPDIFQISEGMVMLAPSLESHKDRTNAVAVCLDDLRSKGEIPGWRGEMYAVGTGFQSPSLFHMERAASVLFGIRIYAINLSGYVKRGDDLYFWVAKRSMTKETSPGKLDLIVSGGQPADITLRENMIKECGEEANIPPELAVQARSVGGITFRTERPEGVLQYVQFNFDLELPDDFTPKNTDGEVEEFSLWPARSVLERVETTDDFAYDSALVVIDFMIRHGIIEADHPQYSELLLGLRTEMADT